MSALVIVVLMSMSGVAPQAAGVSGLNPSSPQKVLSLDARSMRGTPTRMAWSPDGTQLYVRMSEYDRWANETARHYLVDVARRTSASLEGEPPWALQYWAWKAAPSAPERPAFAIKLDVEQQWARTTNVPREGDIGQSKSDPTSGGLEETAAAAAWQSQKIVIQTMTIHGQIVAQSVNAPIKPGFTFSWSPASLGLLAFADQKGRLILMDAQGRTRRIAKTKNVVLPAWSDDGRTIAYFQKASRTRFDLMLVR